MHPTADQQIIECVESIKRLSNQFESLLAEGRIADADLAYENSLRVEYRLSSLKLTRMRQLNGTIEPPMIWHGVNGPCGERRQFSSVVAKASRRAA